MGVHSPQNLLQGREVVPAHPKTTSSEERGLFYPETSSRKKVGFCSPQVYSREESEGPTHLPRRSASSMVSGRAAPLVSGRSWIRSPANRPKPAARKWRPTCHQSLPPSREGTANRAPVTPSMAGHSHPQSTRPRQGCSHCSSDLLTEFPAQQAQEKRQVCDRQYYRGAVISNCSVEYRHRNRLLRPGIL